LEAWHRSTALERGRFLIAGEFLPSYADKLAPLLKHPSVQVLGHRNDIPDLMRTSDILVLPSIEEGFGLVCTEAMASGCVPLVSEACTDLCRHGKNALVHIVGDVEALTHHISLLNDNRSYLGTLRAEGLRTAPGITWAAAGEALVNVYREVVARHAAKYSRDSVAF
jgi:glycosyltransferase involved in cell wall biosynthesis